MRIHEAIEKAREGDEITRPCFSQTEIRVVGGWLKYGKRAAMEGKDVTLSVSELTATDWEVVIEETIEVGDTVDMELCSGTNCEVLGISSAGSVGTKQY